MPNRSALYAAPSTVMEPGPVSWLGNSEAQTRTKPEGSFLAMSSSALAPDLTHWAWRSARKASPSLLRLPGGRPPLPQLPARKRPVLALRLSTTIGEDGFAIELAPTTEGGCLLHSPFADDPFNLGNLFTINCGLGLV